MSYLSFELFLQIEVFFCDQPFLRQPIGQFVLFFLALLVFAPVPLLKYVLNIYGRSNPVFTRHFWYF